MNISLKKRVRNKYFLAFMAALLYKVLQDCGVHILPSKWNFYSNVILWLALYFGIVIDFTTPGIGDPPAIDISKEGE
jgi:uncharacterized membrane protein